MARFDPHERWHREEMERQAKRQADAVERQAEAAERMASGDGEGGSDDANASCLSILIVAGLPVALCYFLIYKFVTSPTLWVPFGSSLVVLVGLCALAVPVSRFGSRLLLCLGGGFFVLILLGLPALIFAHEYNPDAKRPLKWVIGSLVAVIPVGVCLRAWFWRSATVGERAQTPKPRLPKGRASRQQGDETDIICKRWHVGDQSKSYGPYAIEELTKFAHGGQLTADTQVRAVGSSQWVRAGEAFPGLFENNSRPESASVGTAVVGQVIQFTGTDERSPLRAVVTAVEELPQSPGGGRKSTGKFVILFMSVANVGKRSDSVGSRSFHLRDIQGRVFDMVDDSSEFEEHYDREGPYKDIQPGLSTDQVFVYEVAKDSTGYALMLPPDDEE